MAPAISEGVQTAIDSLLETQDLRANSSAFRAAQFDHGLAWVHFPVGCGGLGLGQGLQDGIDAQLLAAGTLGYPTAYMVGMDMVAPTLAVHGSPEQRARHLRRIFSCEELWCQLFSEPGAGSDLASLATRAERDDEDWIIDGQKVWSTMAHRAGWGILLARTDPDVPKHKGLTFFIVDMSAPGIEVRPLRQLTGDAEFNEVFITGARVPDSRRVGQPGEGWRVAMTTLGNERLVGKSLVGASRGGGPIGAAVAAWLQADPALGKRALRDELVRRWVDADALRLCQLRSDTIRGPGSPGPAASMTKIAATELQQRIYDLCSRVRGAGAMLIDNYEMALRDQVAQLETGEGDLNKSLLASLASTIAGGTTEINKTLIGERILGLPAEPRVDKDRAWREVPR